MSEPQINTPKPATLAWIGVTAGAAALAWIGAITIVVLTHTGQVAPSNAIGVCVLAATLTVVLAILGVRYVLQAFAAEDHVRILATVAEHREQCLEEHRQIIATIERVETKLVDQLTALLGDARWQGYVARGEDDPNVVRLRNTH
jgi:hypothetical protein